MKKYLSIILSLVLILGTVFIAPAASVSAATINFTDGVTWTLSEGGSDSLRLTSGWGSATGANGSVTFTDPNSCRSVMANVTGFTAGETYQVSFSATGIIAVYAVLAYDSAYFDGNQNVQAKAGCESDLVRGSYSNGAATITFTPKNDNVYFIVKSNAGSGTLSNFSSKTLSEFDIIVAGMNNGLTWGLSEGGANYLRLTSGWGSFTSANGSVSYTDPNSCRSLMANVGGLTAGKAYQLTFNSSTISGVYAVLDYNSAYFSSDQIVVANAGCEGDLVSGTVANGVATISFTPKSDNIYLIVKNKAGNGTLSNFNIRELTEAEKAGNAIANGTWKTTNGQVSTGGNAVSLTGAHYHSAYTTFGGLTPNTVYELSVDVNTTLNFQIWLLDGNEELKFNDSVPIGASGKTFNATTATLQFTAESESYHLIFRNISATQNYTYSNFRLTKIKTLTEADMAGKEIANNGNWNVTKNAGGTVTKSNDTVTITGAQYQQVSLALTGLKANTTYTLNFNHTAGDVWQFANPAYVIPGETAWTSGLNSKSGTITYGDGSANTNDSTTIRFTTNAADSDYLVVFSCNAPYYNDTLGTVVLTNFTFASETAYEFKGTAIRASSENVEQGMRFKNTISKDLIANGYNGKQVVEYGNIVAYEKNITTDFTYENVDGKNIKKGVAFNANDGTNVVFAETDESIDYTVVLTGIKSAYYDRNCKVRSYILLSDGSVIYGDVQTYCVYAMIQAILAGNNDSDKVVVNKILADEDVFAGYQAWCTNK